MVTFIIEHYQFMKNVINAPSNKHPQKIEKTPLVFEALQYVPYRMKYKEHQNTMSYFFPNSVISIVYLGIPILSIYIFIWGH